MQLATILTSVPGILSITGNVAVPLTAIASDSRQIRAGALFVAYRGVGADGHDFIQDAVARGAAAVVGERPTAGLPVPYVQVDDARAALGWLSAALYGHPSRDMILAAITGTDGKTTTANLLFNILRAAGKRAGLISTVNAIIGDEVHDTGLHTTTPDAPEVQRLLAQMRDAGSEVVVLETTSHGLAQHRVTGCAFDVAVVTNITHEHLDFHGAFEAYREAKALLFRHLAPPESPRKPGQPKTAVLNRDDASFAFLSAIPAERTFTYGMAGEQDAQTPMAQTALAASNIRDDANGIRFDLKVNPGDASVIAGCWAIASPLTGAFNVANIMAATAAALALGVDMKAACAGIAATERVPGRMERIDRGQAFLAIVDFAHTPNALMRALHAARALAMPGGRVIVVFGCAGLRDRQKRRLMGQVAARIADLSLLTAEDPRTEDLGAILDETAGALIEAGRVEGEDFLRVPDRQRAILYAARQARQGDVVIVCGKGHERSMCFGATEYPWCDQDALAWALDLERGLPVGEPPFILPTRCLE